MTWEMSELTYEVTGEHRGWMLVNTETKRTITCESEAEARAIADAPLLLEEVKRLRNFIQSVWDGLGEAGRNEHYELFKEYMGEEEE